MAEKKFIKGLFKDTAHIDQPEGSWRYALNAFINDKDGSVSNEGGTHPDGRLPTVPVSGVIGGVEHYLVIGTIRVDENRVVLFLRDQRSDTSSAIYRSAIAIWESARNTGGYQNGVKILYDDFALRSSGKPGLNFNKENLIEGTFKIDSRQNLIVYFTDDLNPPRAFNITRQEESYTPWNVNISERKIYNIDFSTSPHNHIDILNLFPNSGPVPHIDFFTVYDNTSLDNGDQQSVTHGGGLLTGVYYLALAYTDVDFVSTNFLTVSNPVSITTEYDHTRPTFRKDGAKDGSQTSKAINWKISNLNTDYKYLKPVVIRKMGDAVDAYRLSDVDITVAEDKGVVFSGIEGFVKSSISDVIIDTTSYDTAKTINQLDGVLYLGNLTGTKDLGYQKYANNIKLVAITKKIKDFDEFWATTDNLETGFNTQPVDNGNYVDDSKSYRFDTNIFKYKGYMRDEIYAFYIAFIMKDGSMSYAYHIPGREKISTETGSMINSGTAHIASLGEVNREYAKRFHFFDYSEDSGSNNMNYWENATEFYPNTENYEVWDEDGKLSGADGSIQGLNVRHHHFPSNENEDYQTIHGNNLAHEVSTGTSGTVTPLNGMILMRQKGDGDGYHGSSWRGRRFGHKHSSSTFSTPIINTMIHHTGAGASSCGSPGSNGTTYFTATQPCTVITHYFTLENRACWSSGCSNSETWTRIRTDSSLTPESTATKGQDSCKKWCISCNDSSANRTTGSSSVIELLPGERIWVESKCVTTSRVRPGKTSDNGMSCSSIDGWFSDFYSPIPNFSPGWGTQTTHGSMVCFRVSAGPANMNPNDLLDAKISHNVKRLGFRLEDIKIPKSIADKIQGFRIFYANREHTNKTILGQSGLHPMKHNQEFLGRCSEVVSNSGNVDNGIQVMAQLGSLAELFWSKDPWADVSTNYTKYSIEDNTNGFTTMPGYKVFSFHDFTLLRTKNSIAAATHIKPIYHVRNLVWNGPGLEQERKMLTLITNAGATTTQAEIKEYWGWDVAGSEQNCYSREIHSAIFMGATHFNMKRGTGRYEYPRLLGQKAKMYLEGDSIFKGESLGFGGKVFNEFGESTIAFSLQTKHELPALSSEPTNLNNGGSTDVLTHWGVSHPLTPSILLNEQVDWDLYSNSNHSLRAEQYLVNLCAFKTDVYKSIDSQKLVSTGFEVLGEDLENYVFDDDTGDSTYGGATWNTNTTHPEGVWGGDTFISRYGYGMSLTPNNEKEPSNPKKAIYYQIVESQDNINYRHFESDLSLYFPGTPAKTMLKYLGGDFQEGTTYDFSKSSEIKYNKNYSEVNDLRTAFPLPLRETKQTDFPTRTHRSAKADPTSLIDNWRMFLANNYKDLPKNRGELWKLATFNNLLYFHMEDSLFAAKGKQSMQMKDGSEAFVGSGDIFQQEPDEIIHTKTGYGGTKSQWAALTTRAGYFFVDQKAKKVFLMQDKLVDISLIGMEGWFRNNLAFKMEEYGFPPVCSSDNPLTGFGLHSTWDPKYKRIILTKREFMPSASFLAQFNSQGGGAMCSGGIVGNMRFNRDTCKFQMWVEDDCQTPPCPCYWYNMEWTDSTWFTRTGWTISYLPELNIWVSLHSYVPYTYFNTDTDFYSFSDKYLDYVDGTLASDGVINNDPQALFTVYGNANVWKHNERIKGLLYHDAVGVGGMTLEGAPKHNFELEFIDNSVKTVDKVFYNISYTLQTFAYNEDRNAHDLNVLQHGFTDYHIYNTHQVYSTTAPSSTFEQPLEYFVNVRRVGNSWKINGFRDLAALAIQNTAGGYYMSSNTNILGATNTGTLTTSSINKMFTINDTGSFYSEDLNFAYMNYSKTWNQRRKFIDKWAGIRLIYNNIENNLLNLYSTEVGARKYYR